MQAAYKTVNLEEGMPYCDAAIRRLTAELHTARAQKYAALKLIHGYGSSGTGGRLRVEVRRYLGACVRKGLIKGFIPGESFEIFDKDTQSALMRHSFLSRDSDLGRHNNGITLVFFT